MSDRVIPFFFSVSTHTINQQTCRIGSIMDRKVSLDKKLALAQYIRAENHGNRMKIRQRERILYGTDTQPPLYDTGRLQSMGQQENQSADNDMTLGFPSGTFKYRMILAILLFVGFLICDTGGDKIGKYSTTDIHNMIMADTFHLYGEGNDTIEGMAALLDFE